MPRFVAIGLVLVAAVLGIVLWTNQGNRLILNGSIQKVRLQAVDEGNTVAVADFRINNPADYRFEVKEVRVRLLPASGGPVEGTVFRKADLTSFLEFHKGALGPQYNDSVRIGTQLASGENGDFMVGASFPVSLAEAEKRMGIVIELEAIDGAVPTLIREQRP